MGAPTRDWQAVRLGANPPDALVNLSDKAALAVLAACGVPPELMSGQAQGTAAREAFRRFLHATVTPCWARWLPKPRTSWTRRGWRSIRSTCTRRTCRGRARAFQSMVKGGMEIERAAALSGLLAADDE